MLKKSDRFRWKELSFCRESPNLFGYINNAYSLLINNMPDGMQNIDLVDFSIDSPNDNW